MSCMRHKGFYACSCCLCDQTAVMRQENEVGWALCRDGLGRLTFGPRAEGGPHSVDIPVECPPGSTFFALYHTHPGGTTQPSQADLESARLFRAQAVCIEVPETGELACWENI